MSSRVFTLMMKTFKTGKVRLETFLVLVASLSRRQRLYYSTKARLGITHVHTQLPGHRTVFKTHDRLDLGMAEAPIGMY